MFYIPNRFDFSHNYHDSKILWMHKLSHINNPLRARREKVTVNDDKTFPHSFLFFSMPRSQQQRVSIEPILFAFFVLNKLINLVTEALKPLPGLELSILIYRKPEYRTIFQSKILSIPIKMYAESVK